MRQMRSFDGVNRWRMWALAIAVCAVGASCTTIHSDSARKFAEGVGTVRTESALAFVTLNDLTTETIIDYAATQKTLSEENVFTVLPPKSIAQWDSALGIIEDYGQALTQLTSPDITKGTNDALVSLGTRIHELHTQGTLPDDIAPGLATGFTELADVLIQIHAQREAKAIASAANGPIQKTLGLMAGAIGASPTEGLRLTSASNWAKVLGDDQLKFLGTKAPERRAIVKRFANNMHTRDTQDATWAALRNSLTALGYAHAALAAGSPVDIASAVDLIKGEVKNVQDLKGRFKAANTEEAKK